MTDLVATRLTMALSLGFHIIFACIGMAMPFYMIAAHRRWLKTKDENAYRLTRLWMRGTAIFFATGAVTGTVLSFELGLLWPEFMLHAGPIIGMPFSLEGAAFFCEAIALGLYMYGWGKMSPRVHWWTGLLVGVFGVASGILVVAANSWMNSPTGFTWVDGQAFDISPWKAMLNPAWPSQAVHMTVAAFQAVSFLLAGVHAYLYLRGKNRDIQKIAIRIALPFIVVTSLLQPAIGHWSAQSVAERQPAKLAAMEAHFHTSKRAPLLIGGIPNEEKEEVAYGIKVPGGLSFLAFNDFDAEVVGLDQFPKEDWPPVLIVHLAFQLMVALGSAMAAMALLALWGFNRERDWVWQPKFLWLWVFMAPFGFLALEAGWTVTEVGRQPWIIYEVMRTSEALSPMGGQVWHLLTFSILYLVIGVSTLLMWLVQIQNSAAIRAPSPQVRTWVGHD